MILHFDFSTGAAGDKILGSLIEVCEALGLADFGDVVRLAEALVPGATLERSALSHGGVQATGISVIEDSAPHRHWGDIRKTIEAAGQSGLLSPRAAQHALDAFTAIAQAEAKVHGVDVESVHFHEVGAADSIIDSCCSSYLLDRLTPQAVFATPLTLGFGTFVCSHGEMPVPAPATAVLIIGLPAQAGVHDGELTTPTGAALARTFVSNWQPLPTATPKAVGYGGGTRQIADAANVVRCLVAERYCVDREQPVCSDLMLEGCTLLESNIDHLSPEAMAFACEELLALGVKDVWQEPITMKKGRLAVRLCVLTVAEQAQHFSEQIIRLTGSLGVRKSYVERSIVARAVESKDTAYGELRYKTACVATPEGNIKMSRPEYEDVARLARERGLDFNKLYAELS